MSRLRLTRRCWQNFGALWWRRSLDNSGLRLYVDQSGLVSFTLYEEALAQVFDLKADVFTVN